LASLDLFSENLRGLGNESVTNGGKSTARSTPRAVLCRLWICKSPSQLMSIKLGIVSARNEISEQVISPLPIDNHLSFGGDAADAVRAD
jgi:hypothetical protein